MSFTIPNQASASYSPQAQVDKVDVDILVAGSGRTGVLTGCAVTAQGAPNMTVAVAAGTVEVAAAQASVAGGNVTITAADATNPRFDLICSDNAGTLSAVAGTPAASPVFPSVPANSLALAAVYVPANATSITTGQIVDKRVVLDPAVWNTMTEVAVSGATTLTSASMGKMHVCSGTVAYTVNLPNSGITAGQTVAFAMASGLTALVTLSGNGAQIDGQSTRIMWANETAVLEFNGTNWRKISGKTIPFTCKAKRASSTLALSASTWTLIPMDTLLSGPGLMWDSGNGQILLPRGGVYTCTAFCYISSSGSVMTCYAGVDQNRVSGPAAGPSEYQLLSYSAASAAVAGAHVAAVIAAANDNINLAVYVLAGTSPLAQGSVQPSTLAVVEVPSW